MLVKIIKNNVESEWFELTKAQHRELLESKPDAAIVHIEELYPGSPDRGAVVRLDFTVFTALARDFVLEENRQAKKAERYHDERPIEEISSKDYQNKVVTMEDEYERRELIYQLNAAKQMLTPVQRRRLELYIEDRCSLREIAAREGVHNTAVEDSICAAIKNLKNFWISTSAKLGFLSDSMRENRNLICSLKKTDAVCGHIRRLNNFSGQALTRKSI